MAGRVTIKDFGWRKIKRQLSERAARAKVKVGVLADGSGPQTRGSDGKFLTKEEKGKQPMSTVEIAVLHEFGEGGQHERSFLRKTLDDRSAELAAQMKRHATAVILGRETIDEALGRLGNWTSDAVQDTIRSGKVRPGISEATLDARKQGNGTGTHHALLDTGQLVNSITFEVDG